MSLDAISYQLSFTDWIPIANIPSGILHLICDIRDRIMGKPDYQAPKDSSVIALGDRLLDDWSHLTKALLIISLVGSIVLLVDHIWRNLHFWDLHSIPEKLLNNAEFIKSAVLVHGELGVIAKMSNELKDNKNLILDLIHSGELSTYGSRYGQREYACMSTRLQNDPEIALEFMKVHPNKFDQLPDAVKNVTETNQAVKTKALALVKSDPSVFGQLPDFLKNNVEIIKAALDHKDKLNPEEILRKVPDKNVFKMDEDNLLIKAVEYGIFKLKELDTKFRDDRRYAIAVLYADFAKCPIYMGTFLPIPQSEQFDLLSEARQRDLTVHDAVVQKLWPSARQEKYIYWLYQKAKIVVEQAKENNTVPALKALTLKHYGALQLLL